MNFFPVRPADVLQISTAELAAKAEETRGQLRHLDQQVGHSALHHKTPINPILIDPDTHQSIPHSLGVGLNITELVETVSLIAVLSDLLFMCF